MLESEPLLERKMRRTSDGCKLLAVHCESRLATLGTGKSACHLRSSANTGCVQVANLKKFSAVTCVQNNSLACSLMLVMLASACICEHLRASTSICVLAKMLISYFRVPGYVLGLQRTEVILLI
jgi:hypothetical protein